MQIISSSYTKMKIKHLLLPVIALACVTLTSCSKEEESTPYKETKTICLLKTVVTVNEAWGTFTSDFTYDAHNRLSRYFNAWGLMADTNYYTYNESGKGSTITTMNSKGTSEVEYQYRDQTILSTENGTAIRYTLNSNGKVTRLQNINTSVYTTYEWVGGNCVKTAIYDGSVLVEEKTQTFNTNVINPESYNFIGVHPCRVSANVAATTHNGEAIIYTTNTANLPLTRVMPRTLGNWTATYTYETKTIPLDYFLSFRGRSVSIFFNGARFLPGGVRIFFCGARFLPGYVRFLSGYFNKSRNLS